MTECMVISLPKIPYICTVYDRMYGDFPAKNIVYIHRMTVYLVISLPKIPYIHCMTVYLVISLPKYHISALKITVCLVISLLKIPYVHRIYLVVLMAG